MVPDRSNLLWRCRRGIREMDLLLQAFVENRYDALTGEDKTIFAELLEQPDLDILDWIMGRSVPPPAFTSLINMIRNSGKPGNDTT